MEILGRALPSSTLRSSTVRFSFEPVGPYGTWICDLDIKTMDIPSVVKCALHWNLIALVTRQDVYFAIDGAYTTQGIPTENATFPWTRVRKGNGKR